MFLIEEDATSLDGVTKGYAMYGDPRFFQVTLTENLEGNKEKEVQGWIDKGLVVMTDESSRKTGKRIFFTVKPKQKQVTMEMLRKELEIIRYSQDTFKLAISDGSCTAVTPMRDWIGSCYNNYLDLVNQYKLRKYEQLALKESVVNNAEIVVDHIRKYPKDDTPKIAKALKLDEELVKEITKKSISVLMKIDKEKELQSIEKSKEEVTELKAEDFYKDLLK
jgi:hypothetical protein